MFGFLKSKKAPKLFTGVRNPTFPRKPKGYPSRNPFKRR